MLTLGPAAESSTFCFLAPALIAALAFPEGRAGGPRWFLWFVYGCLALSAVLCWFPFGKHYAGVLQPLAGVAFFIERLGWALGRRARKRHVADAKTVYASRVSVTKESLACAVKA
jgi:hypothetical protein